MAKSLMIRSACAALAAAFVVPVAGGALAADMAPLGGASGSANFLVNPTFAIVENVAGTATFHDIFRAGVNYRFGGPVVAAY